MNWIRRREHRRAGRVARHIVITEARHLVRRHRNVLLPTVAVPLILYSAINWLWARWFAPPATSMAFGWGLMVGLTVAVVLLLLASFGLDQRLTGASAERWSSSQLRKLERLGWRVINDIPADFGNIDHAVVGDAIVLSIETKFIDDSPWLDNSLDRACKQARLGAKRLRLVLSAAGLSGIEVVPVVLRWGIGVGSAPAVCQRGDVTVLSAAHHREWRSRIDQRYSSSGPSQNIVDALTAYADPRRDHPYRRATRA